MIVRVVLVSFCLLNFAQSAEIETSSELPQTTDVLEIKSETDYYADFNDDYAQRIQDVRSMRNWINLGIIAVSLISSLVLLIVIIHLRSKKESRMMSLM